jgi:alkylation response protein AidB-like acyl-CoA dehydrogenase
VPLDAAGVEITPIHTISGERTNAVFFSDVEVSDDMRIGEVDSGWSVLYDRLDVEHGIVDPALRNTVAPPSIRTAYADVLAVSLDAALQWASQPDRRGRRPIDDSATCYRLGEVAVLAEAALVSPDHLGRVHASEALIDGTTALMQVVGASSIIEGSWEPESGLDVIEIAHRFALGTAIYGGTIEVFKNIIAEKNLRLPRLSYLD